MKDFLPEKSLWTTKSPLNFGSHPDLDPDLGIFEGFFLPLWDRGNSAYFLMTQVVDKFL